MGRSFFIFSILSTWSAWQASADVVGNYAQEPTKHPLTKWLSTLKLNIGEIREPKLGITITDLICENIVISSVDSHLTTSDKHQLNLDIQGLGISCSGGYSFRIGGSGHLAAEIRPSRSRYVSGTSASIGLSVPLDDNGAPTGVNVAGCQANLNFKIDFGKGASTIIQKLRGWTLNRLVDSVSWLVRMQVQRKACGQLRGFARTNLTDAIRSLNKVLLPSPLERAESLPLTRSLSAPASLDWTKVSALSLSSWILKDVLGQSGINKVLSWALNGTGRVNASLDASRNFTASIGGSLMDVVVGVRSVAIDGISLDKISPITAASSQDLSGGMSLGNATKPNITARTRVFVHINTASGQLDEDIEFEVGLAKPSIGGRVRVLLDEAKVYEPKSLAQWVFGMAGCAQNALISSPQLHDVDVRFEKVSAPFKATWKTGELEQQFAMLLNNMVGLFNSLYLEHLPRAISHFVASEDFLHTANEKLAELVDPSAACISPHDAASQAQQVQQFADWRKIFVGPLRDAFDNVADGFLKANASNVDDALKDMPGLHVQTDTMKMKLKLQKVSLQGLSAVKLFRLALPNMSSPYSLSNALDIACPSEGVQSTWLPQGHIMGSIENEDEGKQLNVAVHNTIPCGALRASIRAKLDMHKMLMLQIPPPNVSCGLTPFAELAIESLGSSTLKFGGMLMQMQDGPWQAPIQAMCHQYPRLCDRIAKTAHELDVVRVNELLKEGIRSADDLRCSKVEADENKKALPSSGECPDCDNKFLEASPSGSDGVSQNPAVLWTMAVLLIAVLTASAVGLIAQISVQHNSTGASIGCEVWASKDYVRLSPRFYVMGTTLLLACALVLRTVSIFFMNVAYATASFHVDDLGNVGNIDLITFTFFGMVSHYWEAKAYIVAILLLVNSFIVAYGVIFALWLLWVTPVLAKRRSLVIRAVLFLCRFPFVDVVLFSLIITVLNKSLDFPMGINASISCQASGGIYTGVASAFCTMLAGHCLRCAQEPSSQANELPGAHGKWSKLVASICISVGLLIWCIANYFDRELTGLAGDVIGKEAYSQMEVVGRTCRGNAFLAIVLVLMVLLAPLVQAFATWMVGLGKPLGFLFELGNTLALLDIFAAGFLSLILEINDIAQWIVNNKFGDLCAQIDKAVGAECMGVNTHICVAGALGLCLAVAGSFGTTLEYAVRDLMGRGKTRASSVQVGILDSTETVTATW